MSLSKEEKFVNALVEVAEKGEKREVSLFEIFGIMLNHLGSENIKSVTFKSEKKVKIDG